MEMNAVVAEWLRRWTWNPMGSARVGSNPANCGCVLLAASKTASYGDWTHDPWFTRPVLYHWAKEASAQHSMGSKADLSGYEKAAWPSGLRRWF
jgi:hypothetical protein